MARCIYVAGDGSVAIDFERVFPDCQFLAAGPVDEFKGQGEPEDKTLIVYEANPPFDPTTIDAATATMLFGAGFSTVLGSFLLAWGARIVLKVFSSRGF